RMISWHSEESEQEEGRKLAKNVESIGVFIQPMSLHFNKNVGDNCALILAERTDQELVGYLDRLLIWIQDLNWPGACCINDRLAMFQGKEKEQLNMKINTCINRARINENETWKYNLLDLQKDLNAAGNEKSNIEEIL
ncbi:MAG: DUF5071 domain-containing protein, partial [Eubacteriales bacterium]|nr:DUF5071 domain-containing protein [Eubacteriales bacterium]